MNKKRQVNDVLRSIFTLIQDAHNELEKSKKIDQKNNNSLIIKENSINFHKNMVKEKLVSYSNTREGDWSNLNFKRIEFTDDKNITQNSESKEIKPEYSLSEDDIEKVFLNSLRSWQKKNLKNLTEDIYQEIIKESLKNKLK